MSLTALSYHLIESMNFHCEDSLDSMDEYCFGELGDAIDLVDCMVVAELSFFGSSARKQQRK